MTTRSFTAIATVLGLSLVLAAGVAAAQATRQTTTAPDARKPSLIVLSFHADWCKACETLGPKIKAIRTSVSDEPVLFVTLDLTSESSRKQAALLAGALDLGTAWTRSCMRTGQALLVSGRLGEVIATLASDDEPDEFVHAIRGSLARVGKR